MGEDAVETEVLAKALNLNGWPWNRYFLEERGLQAVFVDARGRVLATPGLKLRRSRGLTKTVDLL
ncbi:MAG: hypothetical protein ABSB96_02815 [Gaiellaceae bacterium]